MVQFDKNSILWQNLGSLSVFFRTGCRVGSTNISSLDLDCALRERNPEIGENFVKEAFSERNSFAIILSKVRIVLELNAKMP